MRIFVALLLSVIMSTNLMAEYPAPSELPRRELLPDPLTAVDGSNITTAGDWTSKRRPELKAMFEHYMYGKYPESPQAVSAMVVFEDSEALGGKATLKEIELTTGPDGWPKLYLLIATPPGGPHPCFVGANFGGNHLLTDHPSIRIPTAWMPSRYPGVVKSRATEAGRGRRADRWPLEQILGRGYAVATFYCGDVQPDRPHENERLRAVLAFAESADDPSHTATIMSWAWGIHRAVDHLLTEPSIDPQRIAVVGHSRLGKTALLAGAFDDRIALTVANQAGVGGSGPSRHNDPTAESVARINSAFPHWFCDNFKYFGDDPSKLPFDQNSLVALCAPRPVLFTAAADDLWANPSGQFQVLKAASPVYELLGVEGLPAAAMPEPDAPLIHSRLGFWIRSGKHAMTPADWKVYLDFADKWLHKK